MMRISAEVDFTTVVWMQIFQVIGLPLIFIPISTLSYVGMRKEDNNQISGISNFARKLGGAVVTSFLITFLSRHRQISRAELASHLHAGNTFFDRDLGSLRGFVHPGAVSAGVHNAHSLARLQQVVNGQANVLAFISACFVLSVVVAVLVPLPFLMKRLTPDDLAAAQGLH